MEKARCMNSRLAVLHNYRRQIANCRGPILGHLFQTPEKADRFHLPTNGQHTELRVGKGSRLFGVRLRHLFADLLPRLVDVTWLDAIVAKFVHRVGKGIVLIRGKKKKVGQCALEWSGEIRVRVIKK